MFRLRPALWPTLISLPIFVVSLGLGIWQMERRAWKQDILHRIEVNQAAAPIILDGLVQDREPQHVHRAGADAHTENGEKGRRERRHRRRDEQGDARAEHRCGTDSRRRLGRPRRFQCLVEMLERGRRVAAVQGAEAKAVVRIRKRRPRHLAIVEALLQNALGFG